MESRTHAEVLLKGRTNYEADDKQRRSANYKPNIWKYDFLQSLSTKYDEDQHKRRCETLKEDVKKIFVEAKDFLAKLELVDSITKLGLASHFEEEIKVTLETISSSMKNKSLPLEEDLYATALSFRLLRQYGYEVTQDIFRGFLDEMGTFTAGKCPDIRGVLELFEASHLGFEGEIVLDGAKAFSTGVLMSKYTTTQDSNLCKRVLRALDQPYHWRVQWFDVKWHINAYEVDGPLLDRTILELAKVNFNVVQATLQKDLREISRWWRNLGLMEKLNFARDRLVESFLCAVGVAFEPKYSSLRKCLTKAIIMVLVIDDVYDVYGSLEELQCFTNAVNRGDPKEIEGLPECMKTCFEALVGTADEVAYEMAREKGWSQVQPQSHLKEGWAEFCEALFVEAKWYNNGYIPTLQEYLSNAWITSSGIILAVHIFFSITGKVTQETISFLEQNHDLLHNISLIIRLCNDLGTSKAEQERGDAASSVVCYMEEGKVDEEAARKNVSGMINQIWKKINGKSQALITRQRQLSSNHHQPELKIFDNLCTNMARVAHYLYQNGDKFHVQDRDDKRQFLSLLVEPVRVE